MRRIDEDGCDPAGAGEERPAGHPVVVLRDVVGFSHREMTDS
jgi:hypothetical protein